MKSLELKRDVGVWEKWCMWCASMATWRLHLPIWYWLETGGELKLWQLKETMLLYSSLKSSFRIAAGAVKNKCFLCEIDVETQIIASGAWSSEVGSCPFASRIPSWSLAVLLTISFDDLLPSHLGTLIRCSSSSSSSSGPGAYAPDTPQPIGLLCDPCPPLIFRRSHFRRQVPPRPYDARDPSSERWNCGRECWPVILPKYRLPRYI